MSFSQLASLLQPLIQPAYTGCPSHTLAINEGCTRSLRISHTSRAPLQPVTLSQVPCTPYHPPNIAGVAVPGAQLCLHVEHTQALLPAIQQLSALGGTTKLGVATPLTRSMLSKGCTLSLCGTPYMSTVHITGSGHVIGWVRGTVLYRAGTVPLNRSIAH